jgi:hypothetical protein
MASARPGLATRRRTPTVPRDPPAFRGSERVAMRGHIEHTLPAAAAGCRVQAPGCGCDGRYLAGWPGGKRGDGQDTARDIIQIRGSAVAPDTPRGNRPAELERPYGENPRLTPRLGHPSYCSPNCPAPPVRSLHPGPRSSCRGFPPPGNYCWHLLLNPWSRPIPPRRPVVWGKCDQSGWQAGRLAGRRDSAGSTAGSPSLPPPCQPWLEI